MCDAETKNKAIEDFLKSEIRVTRKMMKQFAKDGDYIGAFDSKIQLDTLEYVLGRFQ